MWWWLDAGELLDTRKRAPVNGVPSPFRERDPYAPAMPPARNDYFTASKYAPGLQVPDVRLAPLPSDVVTLDNFATDKHVLTPEHVELLRLLVVRLKKTLELHPRSFFSIVGHADAPGTNEHNLALGRNRATTVLGHLADKGISRDIMSARSFGEESLAVPIRTREPRNRRVEIVIHQRGSLPIISLTQSPRPMPGTQPPYALPPTHIPAGPRRLPHEINEEVQKSRPAVESLRFGNDTPKIAQLAGDVLAGLTKSFPPAVQKFARELGESLPLRGLCYGLESIAANRSINREQRDMLRTSLEAAARQLGIAKDDDASRCPQ
jgi:OOP family OmpA-OmpF porin